MRPEYGVEDEMSFVERVGFPKAGDRLVRLQGLTRAVHCGPEGRKIRFTHKEVSSQRRVLTEQF